MWIFIVLFDYLDVMEVNAWLFMSRPPSLDARVWDSGSCQVGCAETRLSVKKKGRRVGSRNINEKEC